MPENETPTADPAPLEIPRDAAKALYAALGTMLGIPQDDGAAIDDDRRERYEAAIRDVLETDRYWGGEKAAADAAMRLADAEQASLAASLAKARRAADLLAEGLRLSQQRADQAEAERDWERRVTTAQQRELETLRRRADQAEESLRRINIELQHWQTVIAGGLRADLDQARAEGVALQTALVELAGNAGDGPATAACFRGIADRWKYNGVSRLAECAGILLAALPAPAEHPHA